MAKLYPSKYTKELCNDSVVSLLPRIWEILYQVGFTKMKTPLCAHGQTRGLSDISTILLPS